MQALELLVFYVYQPTHSRFKQRFSFALSCFVIYILPQPEASINVGKKTLNLHGNRNEFHHRRSRRRVENKTIQYNFPPLQTGNSCHQIHVETL